MKHTIILIPGLLAAMALLLVAGCTYYVPATLDTSRVGDTLTVALDGPGAARWNPARDSLVLECPGCAKGTSMLVSHFRDRNEARYDVPSTQNLTLILYMMGHQNTTNLSGTATQAATAKPRFVPHHRAATAPATPTPAEIKAAAEARAAAEERALKKTTLLKVTAPEGVAIYKDKTKRHVIKILPQGSTIVLLAREGDLYSVSIDGQEGFVDAQAVEVQQ